MKLDKLFQSIKINEVELRNRIVMAPMETLFDNPDGSVGQRQLDFCEARAKGGAGMLIMATAVSSNGIGAPNQLRVHDDSMIPGLSELAQCIKKHGATPAIQLNHAGRYSHSAFLKGEQPVSASPLPSRITKETPRELRTEEVDGVATSFADAAVRAKKAGFEVIEILASTGYLISQFLSSCTNKRTDRYGGGIYGRATFLVEIIEKMREKVGSSMPICCKLSVEEFMPEGNSLEDGKIVAKLADEAGASILHAWAGWHESPKPMLSMSVPRGAFIYLAEALKEISDLPVIGVGRVNDPRLADQIIREKRADMVAIGRGLLADPELPNKAMAGNFDDIRMCTACNNCFDRILTLQSLQCSINPALGREGEYEITPADQPKSILVVGGGPAGMEAARVLTLRGHDVILTEENSELGGQLLLATVPPHKEEIGNLVQYLTNQLKKLGVDTQLNTKMTPEEIEQMNVDAVILATGALPLIPDIPGVDQDNVYTAHQVLQEKPTLGDSILVIGGGLVGCEVAEYLHEQGKKVTIIEQLKRIGNDIGQSVRWIVLMRLGELGIETMTRTKAITIDGDQIRVDVKKEGEKTLSADSIVLATGSTCNSDLVEKIGDRDNVYVIGDCKKPGKITEAMHEAAKVGREI